MFERVIPEATAALIETIGGAVKGFYLAGGTGLSLLYYRESLNDADAEPDPVILAEGSQWHWSTIRQFFERHIRDFEAHLLDGERL